MVTLQIDLSDVLDETHDDDVVVVWPPVHREGSRGQVIAPRKRTISLAGGKATVEVEPGPLNVQIRAQDGRVDGEVRRLTVPEGGPVTLTALLDGAGDFTYAPPVVGRVALDAQRAEDAAVRAEGVADAFGSLEGVVDQVQAASGYAQAALEEADRSSSEADRAEAAAQSASTGVQPDTVGRPHLTPGLRGEIDGKADKTYVDGELANKANIGDVPVTDGGYGTHHVSDPAADYPKGVSYGLYNATDESWSAAIQADTGYTNHSTFVMVQTLRQSGYTRSTTQLVFTYDNVHKPVFMRKWYAEAWGPFRSLTDDGHTHTSEDITDLPSWSASNDLGTLVQRSTASGNFQISPPSHPQHATTKEYVDAQVGGVSSRVTTLENSAPIIVSSLPSSPLPGRIYYVTG